MNPFIDKIKERILQAFDDAAIEISDQSEAHASHKGSTGGGHYVVVIKSNHFKGLSRIERHRRVYALFEHDFAEHIHALSIKAMTH